MTPNKRLREKVARAIEGELKSSGFLSYDYAADIAIRIVIDEVRERLDEVSE